MNKNCLTGKFYFNLITYATFITEEAHCFTDILYVTHTKHFCSSNKTHATFCAAA